MSYKLDISLAGGSMFELEPNFGLLVMEYIFKLFSAYVDDAICLLRNYMWQQCNIPELAITPHRVTSGVGKRRYVKRQSRLNRQPRHHGQVVHKKTRIQASS